MNNTIETPTEINEPKRRGPIVDFFIRLFKEKPLGMLGGVIILLLIGISLFAVVLVKYRLSPEHRYPVAADDSYAAMEWTAAHLQDIAGVDVPLFVAGDSAGGNLGAVVSVRARDCNGPEIALQILIYPVTDADFDRPSYTDPENALLLTREAMIWFWDHYVPDPAKRAEPDA